jgi:uncharacterized protein (DUF305 family)
VERFAELALGTLLLIAVLASCGGASSGGTGDAQSGHSGNYDDSMSGMGHDHMGASDSLLKNGRYSDERFIDLMVPHHRGAVDMAEVALENAEHEEIRHLAENIISTQQAEIEELRSIKEREFGTSHVPMKMNQQRMQAMGMIDPQDLANQKPFDKAFIDAMIPHHQSAIEMANVASERSYVPEIKRLANDIVDAQQKEIAQMEAWRDEWYPQR